MTTKLVSEWKILCFINHYYQENCNKSIQPGAFCCRGDSPSLKKAQVGKTYMWEHLDKNGLR